MSNVDDNAEEAEENKDDWSEDDVETPAGVTDTMLTATNFFEDNEQAHIYSIAPGE